MKLPQILSSAPVPTSTGIPEGRPAQGLPQGFGSSMSRALVAVGSNLEQTASQIGAAEAHAQARRRALEEQSEALTLMTEAELAVKDFRFNLERTPDYKTHTARMQQGLQEIAKKTLAKSKNPNVKAALQQRMARLGMEEIHAARSFEERLFVDTQVASLEQNLANLRQLAATGGPDELAKYAGLGVGAIRGAVQGGLIKGVDGGKRERDFLEDISLQVARREIDADPEAWLQESGAYTHIEPLKMQSLKEHASKLVEMRDAKAERQRQAQERQAEKALKEQQSMNTSRLMMAVRSGGGSIEQINNMRMSRQISEEDHRVLLNYIDSRANRAEAAAARADAANERGYRNVEAEIRVLAKTGVLDEAGVLDLAKQKNLPARVVDGALDDAKSRRNAMNSERGKEHSQAEQTLRAKFFKGTFDVLPDAKQQAYDAALTELTDRSLAYGGKEGPLDIVNDVAAKHLKAIELDDRGKLQTIEGRLRFKTPDQLQASRGSLSPGEFREQQRLLKQYQDLAHSVEAAEFEAQQKAAPTPKQQGGAGFWERWWGSGPAILEGQKKAAPTPKTPNEWGR